MVSAIEKQLLQSQVMERIQQVQQQHPDMQQQYFKIQFGRERRRLKKKVIGAEEIYHVQVDDNDGADQQIDHLRQQGALGQEMDNRRSVDERQPDHIDIKV
jgi:hypothetical protein